MFYCQIKVRWTSNFHNGSKMMYLTSKHGCISIRGLLDPNFDKKNFLEHLLSRGLSRDRFKSIFRSPGPLVWILQEFGLQHVIFDISKLEALWTLNLEKYFWKDVLLSRGLSWDHFKSTLWSRAEDH